MQDFWNICRAVIAAIGGWLGWFLGGCDGLVIALVIFVVIDYITGVMCATVDHRLNSEIGFRGICKKIVIFMLIGVAQIIDANVIGSGAVLRTAVLFFYLANEGLSIIENAAHLGLPVPEKLKAVLEQLHNRAEKEN